MTILRRLTGQSFDRLSTSLGLRPAYHLKYGAIEFIPCPLIKKNRSQPLIQLGPNELTQANVMKWTVSLPHECADLFPLIADWDSATAPGARWSVTLPNTETWIDTVVEGDRQDGHRGRVVITLAAIGLDY